MSPKTRAVLVDGPRGYRERFRALQDPLNDTDRNYELCRYTGLSHASILRIIGECEGNVTCIVANLHIRFNVFYADDGYWKMLAGWLRLYAPQWHREFRRTMADLVTQPDPVLIANIASQALGIEPDQLLYLSTHQHEVEAFLASQRSLLGVLAESQLWKLVAQGDAATVRWVLARVKPELFGDKKTEAPPEIQTIEIIERPRPDARH